MPLISDATIGLAKIGLDMASIRQQVIAHNIANANTPSYSPLRVNFGDQIATLLEQASTTGEVDFGTDLTPQINTAPGPVALDQEVAALSQNTLHYQTIAKALSRHFGLYSLAINDGKR